MSFANGVNVNVNDYKTSKLVLTRIDSISGEKSDTFTMGSHATDYNQVIDSKKLKYKDSEAITSSAIDDYAEVTLGNGGSYQKKDGLYGNAIMVDRRDADGEIIKDKDNNPI